MDSFDQWDFLAALPFLAAAAGIAYVAVVALSGTAMRLRRKQKRREFEAGRRQMGDTPWDQWLREINDKAEKQADRAEGKWRE